VNDDAVYCMNRYQYDDCIFEMLCFS
jgi:hypothetical protein